MVLNPGILALSKALCFRLLHDLDVHCGSRVAFFSEIEELIPELQLQFKDSNGRHLQIIAGFPARMASIRDGSYLARVPK